MFDTKVALIIRDDLLPWQRLNVAAFLATGIAAGAPDALGEPYLDAEGAAFGRMLGQPILVFLAGKDGLEQAARVARERGLLTIPYVAGMFRTGNDADNRACFQAEDPASPDWVGIGLRGPKKGVEKATKGLSLHP